MVQSVVTVPYAPEFRDLSDNAPLLEAIAQETGGRELPADPKGVELFDRAGLVFPETAQPLAAPLILVWIALFLLDVAVRRLAIDFRAMGRRAVGWASGLVRAGAGGEVSAVARLRTRTLKVREQLSARGPAAAREPAAEAAGDLRPGSPAAPAAGSQPAAPPVPPKPEAPAPPAPKTKGDYLDQLLRARRRARKRTGKDDSGEG
jgi:hypothetical protein